MHDCLSSECFLKLVRASVDGCALSLYGCDRASGHFSYFISQSCRIHVPFTALSCLFDAMQWHFFHGGQQASGSTDMRTSAQALTPAMLSLLDRPASQVLDDASLAMYIVLRTIPQPRQLIMDEGTFYYFRQFPSDVVATEQIRTQIQHELEDATMTQMLSFFRHMLDHQHCEDFYEAIYRRILAHMTLDPRPITEKHPSIFTVSLMRRNASSRLPSSSHVASVFMNNTADLVVTASAVTSNETSVALEDNVGALSPAPTERDSACDSDVTLDYGGDANHELCATFRANDSP